MNLGAFYLGGVMTKTYIIESYYADNGIKMRKLVDRILYQMNVYTNDMNEYYSLANEVFVKALEKYDESRDFESMFFVCFSNKVKNMLRDQNRAKRKNDYVDLSIDDVEVGDCRQDHNFRLSELLSLSEKMVGIEKELYAMILYGYDRKDIVAALQIADWQYDVHRKSIKKKLARVL